MPWGCIVGMRDGVPIASHLPFLVKGEPGRETLDGHMAGANPHWKTFADGAEVLVVFQGPHTYVTPSLCKAERASPFGGSLNQSDQPSEAVDRADGRDACRSCSASIQPANLLKNANECVDVVRYLDP